MEAVDVALGAVDKCSGVCLMSDAISHASRRRERQARRTVTLITAVVATRWIDVADDLTALVARRRAS